MWNTNFIIRNAKIVQQKCVDDDDDDNTRTRRQKNANNNLFSLLQRTKDTLFSLIYFREARERCMCAHRQIYSISRCYSIFKKFRETLIRDKRGKNIKSKKERKKTERRERERKKATARISVSIARGKYPSVIFYGKSYVDLRGRRRRDTCSTMSIGEIFIRPKYVLAR